ncbi:hypothetical protein ABVK25_007425 [Lepraria finkii]|uniref:Major facilitator superfamily (MFS) profile domain-containing protein n=1 Tax=Lepraria finkii TaxID=1340010 RepID=A0ABR4B5D3_9LECA
MAIGIIWKIFSSKQLNIAIQAFSLIAIFFKGYDQGVMGGVNASPDYVTTVGIGLPNGTFTNTTHQSGIVSIYYLGTIVGAFVGGWAADRIGRINGLFCAASGHLFSDRRCSSDRNSEFEVHTRRQ